VASTQGSSTRIHPSSAPPPPSPPPAGGGLELTTLFLSAVASAVAAYVTSKIWAAGTLFSAAMSPVIVALVKEGLRKPTDIVASAVPSPRVLARAPRGEVLPGDLSDRLDAGAPPPFPPPEAGAPAGPVRVYSTRGRRLRWRLALVTGLLGFVVCVVAYTLPEVLAGRSVVHSGDKTTLWGGARHHRSTTTSPTTTVPRSSSPTTTGAPAQGQPAQTVTAPPRTVTVSPPTATQPPPAATTPPPAGSTTPRAPPGGAAGGQTTPAG
jgi:hypothetical protein